MKKLLLLGLLLVGCVKPAWSKCKEDNKFKFGDKVQVISGFYQGITGVVIARYCFKEIYYEVEFSKNGAKKAATALPSDLIGVF